MKWPRSWRTFAHCSGCSIVSVILVHHTRKNAAGGAAAGLGLRGSSDIHAFGDSNLYLRRGKEHLVLSTEHRAAPASPPIHLALVTTNPETTHLEVIAQHQDGKPRSLEEQVLDVLGRRHRAHASEAPRLPCGQERASGRGARVAGARWPVASHGRGLAASGLIARRVRSRSPYRDKRERNDFDGARHFLPPRQDQPCPA